MANNNDNDNNEKGKFNLMAELKSWLGIIITAAAIAFCLNTFIIANSHVPSASMENTIMTGDRVIGFRLSYLFEDPKRGDVIIFRYPDDEKTFYVKRIIGIPGEPYIKEPMIPEPDMHFEVPENGYFCMGDNRNSSGDARYWHNTYVYKNKIISKVIFRYFPNIGLIK